MNRLRSSATRALFVLLASTTLAQSPVIAQADSFFNPQVFITLDTDSVQGWTSGYTNFVVEDQSGNFETIDLSVLPLGSPAPAIWPSGFGAYGLVYVDGNYVIEPFHYSQSYGNHGGVLHPTSYSIGFGAWASYEASPGVGPFHRQGLRLARTDGQPFWLRSLQYIDAASDFGIGYQLSVYSDTSAWSTTTPVLSSSTWNMLGFEPRPYDIDTIAFAPGAPISFNTAASTFSLQAFVTSVRRTNGTLLTASTADPLIGGTLTITGLYSGTDLAGLSDLTLQPAALTFVSASSAHQLSLTAAFTAGPAFSTLTGPQGFPQSFQVLSSFGSISATETGAGSEALQGLRLRASNQPISLRFATGPGGAYLQSLERPLSVGAASQPAYLWTNDGQGGLAFSAVNMGAGTVLRNLFELNPPGLPGLGPIFGIGLTPQLFDQFQLPLGTPPLHISTSLLGNYFWAVPAGTIPAGLIVDFALLSLPPGATTFTFHGVERLSF